MTEAERPSSERARARRLRHRNLRLVLPLPSEPDKVLPLATIGLDAQGALFIAPTDVGGCGWFYGLLRPEQAPVSEEMHRTEKQPKLMWHESGEVHASHSEGISPRIKLQMTPFSRLGSQRLSLMACWPTTFALPVAGRLADALVLPHGLQQTEYAPAAIWLQFRLRFPDLENDYYIEELGPLGLNRQDASSFMCQWRATGENSSSRCPRTTRSRPSFRSRTQE